MIIQRFVKKKHNRKIDKRLHLSLSKEMWPRNLNGSIILTSIVAKVCNILLLKCIQPGIVKILTQNQNGFWNNRSTTSQILTIWRIIEGVCAKNSEAALMFVDFSKGFDFIHRGKTAQIFRTNDLPQITFSALMMLYENTKAIVRSPDGDTDLFHIATEVLQEDSLAPFLCIICQDYVLRKHRSNERKWFRSKKGRSR